MGEMPDNAGQIRSGPLATQAVSNPPHASKKGTPKPFSVNIDGDKSSEPYLTAAATALKNRIRHQSNRWLNHNLGADDVRGCENEVRWGFRWDVQLCERVDRERAEARRIAGVGPED